MSSPLLKDDVIFTQRFLKAGGLYEGSLDGVWGPLTDAASAKFDMQSIELAQELDIFDGRSERMIFSLQLPAQRAARVFLTRVRTAQLDIRILSGTRSYAEQNALFRQGRFGNAGPRVTNARGGQSNHNFGIAWDIGVFEGRAYLGESPLYDRAAEIGLVEGLSWGGNWISFQDRPHYQLDTGLGVSETRRLFEQGERYF